MIRFKGMDDAVAILVQILLIANCFDGVTSSCKHNFPSLKYGAPEVCCPDKFSDICCPDITRCNTSQPWMPTPCAKGTKDVDCLAGFVSDRTGKILASPGGLFSPAGVRCAIPCVAGAYCAETFLNKPINTTKSECYQESKCCRYSDGEIANVAAVDESSNLLCPGAHKWGYCPDKYYCPDPAEKIECNSSGLCPKAVTEPLECNLLHECARNGNGYIGKWVAILFLIILLILSFAVYTFHLYRKEAMACIYTILGKGDGSGSSSLKYGLTNVALKTMAEKDNEMERIQQPIDITFSNLNYETAGKHILKDAVGTFKHSSLTAIMGPSGCGKTTIMNILRGKLREGVTGDIKWNGEPLHNLVNSNSVIGYAPQEDIMHCQLTVEEVLTYRANITCASWKSAEHRAEYIKNLMSVLGLSAIADSLVGGEGERGISGGQKRRLNVGMELVSNPTILFCDEPTSGLDSSTSLELCRTLRNIAETSGINIICVIHQPRYECFALFHHLLLLSSQGKVVYEGQASGAQRYFESLDYSTIPHANPADFIIDIANGTKISSTCASGDLPFRWTQKLETDQLKSKLTKWATSINVDSYFKPSDTTLVDVAANSPKCKFDFKPPPKPSILRQLFWLFKREVILQIRNSSQFIMEIIMTLCIGGLLGGMYTKPAIQNQIGKLAMASLCIGILSLIMAMKFIGNNWDNVLREADGGVSMLGYYLAVNLISSPIVVLTLPLSFLCIYHTVSDTRSTFTEHYITFVCTVFAATGYGLLVSCSVNRKKMYLAGVAIILVLVFGGGSNMSLCDMSKITLFGPLLYSCSFARWFLEAQYEVEAKYYSPAETNSVYYYAKRNLYDLESRELCLWALFAIGMVTRILAFVILKFRTK